LLFEVTHTFIVQVKEIIFQMVEHQRERGGGRDKQIKNKQETKKGENRGVERGREGEREKKKRERERERERGRERLRF